MPKRKATWRRKKQAKHKKNEIMYAKHSADRELDSLGPTRSTPLDGGDYKLYV